MNWPTPCEEYFEQLAELDPMALLAWIRSETLKPEELTFAAEIAGKIQDSDLVRITLLPLLLHSDAAVREGVIYGLSKHLTTRIVAMLKDISLYDENQAVRIAALDAIDEFEIL